MIPTQRLEWDPYPSKGITKAQRWSLFLLNCLYWVVLYGLYLYIYGKTDWNGTKRLFQTEICSSFAYFKTNQSRQRMTLVFLRILFLFAYFSFNISFLYFAMACNTSLGGGGWKYYPPTFRGRYWRGSGILFPMHYKEIGSLKSFRWNFGQWQFFVNNFF